MNLINGASPSSLSERGGAGVSAAVRRHMEATCVRIRAILSLSPFLRFHMRMPGQANYRRRDTLY